MQLKTLILVYTISAQEYRIAFDIDHSEVSSHLRTVELLLKCAMGSSVGQHGHFTKKITKLLLHTSLDTIPYTNAKMICISWSNVVTGPSGRTKLTSPLPV